MLRNCDEYEVTEADVKNLAAWKAEKPAELEIPFKPARVVLQDFTGVPCVVDLAAMRSAMKRLGGDPKKINPLVPVDLVIDHSIQVDYFGAANSLDLNVDLEFTSQSRAVRVSALGPKSVQQFPRGAAEHWHRAPGEFGIPRQSGVRAEDRRRKRGPARYAGRHR